jgi:hypothetical protein
MHKGTLQYLSLCHTKNPDTELYATYAYTFSATAPYAIKLWSNKLELLGQIQMALSAVRVRQDAMKGWIQDDAGKWLLVSYGRDDKEMRIAIFGKFIRSCQH